MDKFCTKCGAELNEDGLCPNCSAGQAESAAEETAPVINEENTQPTTTEPEQPEEAPVQTEPEAETQVSEDNKPENSVEPPQATVDIPPAEVADVQPSKFYYAFRQVGKLLGHFFSKRTVDTISDQYSERLPIWVILLPVCAIISALSMTLSFDATHGLSIGAGSLFSGMKLSGLEVFLISFAMSVAVEFVYSIAVIIFLKSFKIKTSFKSAANLTLSAYIAVSIIDLFNILTIGFFKSESTTLSGFGMIAFILLLYLGITKVLDGKKPFWSFFLMMTCASIAALIVALVVTCPIIVIRGLQELAGPSVVLN